jgi:hypothetical protein
MTHRICLSSLAASRERLLLAAIAVLPPCMVLWQESAELGSAVPSRYRHPTATDEEVALKPAGLPYDFAAGAIGRYLSGSMLDTI